MRRSNQCLRCRKTTAAHTASICVACGGRMGAAEPWIDRYNRPTALLILTMLMLLTILALVYADSYVPALTEWYLEKAVAPEIVS